MEYYHNYYIVKVITLLLRIRGVWIYSVNCMCAFEVRNNNTIMVKYRPLPTVCQWTTHLYLKIDTKVLFCSKNVWMHGYEQ